MQHRAADRAVACGCLAAVLSVSLPGAAQPQSKPPAPPAAQPQPTAPPATQPPTTQPPTTQPPTTQPPPSPAPPPAAASGAPAPAAQPPPGYGPPPGPYGPYPYPYPYAYPYGPPQNTSALGPKTMPYREDQPIPPGYHVESHARKGLAIAGGSLFGGAYLISVIGASAAIDDNNTEVAPLFIPVAGPFITIGTTDILGQKAYGFEVIAFVILLFDGIAQVGGLTMMIAGLAAEKTELVRNDLAAAGSTRRAADSGRGAWSPSIPTLSVGSRSAALRWRF